MKQKLVDGWEWDVTGKSRHIHGYKSGTVSYVKRKMRRRLRQDAKAEMCEYLRDVAVANWDHWRDDESCDQFEGTSIREERVEC